MVIRLASLLFGMGRGEDVSREEAEVIDSEEGGTCGEIHPRAWVLDRIKGTFSLVSGG